MITPASRSHHDLVGFEEFQNGVPNVGSQLGAELWVDAVPLSGAAARQRGAREAALAGGDDYEILFAVDPEQEAVVDAIANSLVSP